MATSVVPGQCKYADGLPGHTVKRLGNCLVGTPPLALHSFDAKLPCTRVWMCETGPLLRSTQDDAVIVCFSAYSSHMIPSKQS